MKTKNHGCKNLLPVVLLSSLGALQSGHAQQGDVLDPAQHPQSPVHEPIFPQTSVPLNAELSWTERFNGDETFNPAQTLRQSTPMTSMMSRDESTDAMNMESKAMQGMKMDGQGVVKSIRSEQGKVKIEHGPIDKFEMPAMTMMFKVGDVSMLDGLEPGTEVGFDVDNTSGGFVITHIMPKMAMMSDQGENSGGSGKMDGRGVIKAIRAEQGKIKIEHGPIDKYGMPAMTMMFKVDDPELLKTLKSGSQVEFNVDNSSGGFVITDIAPASE